jgi:cytochrome P450 family 110
MSSESSTVAPEIPAGLPPGPTLPGSRVAQLWIEALPEFLEGCALRYGETFTIELGSIGTTVVFSNPEAVRQIFQLAQESYECRSFNEYYQSVMGSHSLFLSDGALHRRMRRAQMAPLRREATLEHGQTIRRLTRAIIAEWPAGRAFSPRISTHMLSLRVMLAAIFGSDRDELGREIAGVFSREIYQELGSWSVWTRFSHFHPRFRELIAARIHWSRAAGSDGDASLFHALVDARDEAGDFLSDEEIQDQVFTLLVAGVDPVALAVCWALYRIHEEPDVLARLRRELAADSGAGEMLKLAYLTAVCQETLRLHPIPSTPSGRKLLASAEIQGRRYEPGVTLLPCTYLVHRRSDLYPEPARFRPERFLERQFGSHEYFPFGGGARTCIGLSFASVEMAIVLAEILTRCNLVPAHDGPVDAVRHGTLLAPSDAMRFLLAGSPDSSGGAAR